MEVTRIIHPVGQGGFYSETFKKGYDVFNVIYDCGGNSKTSIDAYLENYYPSDLYSNTIDAVFISHLHDDHINGLQYLLENLNVKYLFLPQLTKNEKLEIVSHTLINNRIDFEFVSNLLNDESSEINGTKIIRVKHDNGESQAIMEINNDTDKSFDTISVNTIECGTKIHLLNKWLFIPYNPPVVDNNNGFEDCLKNELCVDNIDVDNLPSIVKEKGVKSVKDAYEKFFKSNHNAYSMALFSGLAKTETRPYYKYCDDCCIELFRHCYHFRKMNGYRKHKYCTIPNCLYMGDFDTEKQIENLKRFYRNGFWETVASIQSPHHGSRNNFSPDLYEYAHKSFISVGEKNKYHHPNVDTIIGIVEKGCQPIIVTESLSTMRMYHYSF